MAPFPLTTADYITIGLQLGIIVSAFIVIIATWFQTAHIRSKKIKISLGVYHALNIITMTQGSLCLWQIFSPSDLVYLTNAVSYGMTLAASYIFYFAKQQSVTKETLRFFEPSFKERHERFEKLFVVTFFGYFVFVWILPFIGITKTDPDHRVSYNLPLWTRIAMAVGDTVISAICLYLFVSPVREFAKMAVAVEKETIHSPKLESSANGRANWLRKVAKRNAYMALLAIVSTTTFFVVGSWLDSNVWIVVGCSDLLVNLVAVRFMFVSKNGSGCLCCNHGGNDDLNLEDQALTPTATRNEVSDYNTNATSNLLSKQPTSSGL